MPAKMSGRWAVLDDFADGVTLTVELWNGFAVTLTSTDDDGSAVVIWKGPSGRDFADETATTFRAWLNDAQGRGARR